MKQTYDSIFCALKLGSRDPQRRSVAAPSTGSRMEASSAYDGSYGHCDPGGARGNYSVNCFYIVLLCVITEHC